MAVTGYPFYTPFSAVGQGKTNETADVMLIQYMLYYTMVMADSGWRFPGGPTLMEGISPNALFPFDGVWKPDLKGWIVGFQKYTGPGLGYTLTADGVVNQMTNYWGDKEGHKRVYTIQALNDGLLRANREQFMHLWDMTNLPSRLAEDLKIMRMDKFHAMNR